MIEFSIYFLFAFTQLSLTQGNQQMNCSLDNSPCIKDRAAQFWNLLIDGTPELMEVKKLDKIYLGNFTYTIGHLNYEIYNLEVKGLKGFIIDSFRIDLDLKLIHIMCHTTLVDNWKYNLNGSLFSIPISGSGNSTAIRKNVRVNIIVTFDITNSQNGKSIMKLNQYYFGSDTRDGVIYNCDDILIKNKKTDYFNKFLTENWLLMSQKYGRGLLDIIVNKIYNAARKYLKNHPVEDESLLFNQ